jgi:prefoldin beta subunit
MLKSSL